MATGIRKKTRTISRKVLGRNPRAKVAATRAKLTKAAKTLEKAASVYAKRAKEAGISAGKTAKRITRTRAGKILATAALAAAGYAASKVIRGK